MIRQLALWDEAAALSSVITSELAFESNAREALAIAARLVTIDMRFNSNEMDKWEYAVALDVLVNRAANLFTVEQHTAMEVPE